MRWVRYQWAWQKVRLQEFFKIVAFDFSVLEDLIEQARAERFPGVNGNDSRTAIRVAEKVMTALRANVDEARALQRLHRLTPGDPPQPAHTSTAIRCTPMNSGPATPEPSTSRQSSMASLMRTRSLSSERACVWQPRSSGTLPT